MRICINYLPQFQSFSVLDEIGTKLFIERYYHDIGMEDLDLKKYIDTDLFIKVMNLLNENWTDEYKWSSEVRSAFHKYKDKLYSEHFLDYSLILREMVEQIQTSLVFQGIIREKVKYLTIDEYQDTNPVQEKLVEALKGFGAISVPSETTIRRSISSGEVTRPTSLHSYRNTLYRSISCWIQITDARKVSLMLPSTSY